MRYQFTPGKSDDANNYLDIIAENDVDRLVLRQIHGGEAQISSYCYGGDVGWKSLTVAFRARKNTAPAAPIPTPAAPDPGPGWRLKKVGEMITEGDQMFYGGDSASRWMEASIREPVEAAIIRTPIYHNPANLESAGEGYRFCLKGDTEDAATHWWDHEANKPDWVVNRSNGLPLAIRYTYRTNKPLPTT